MEVLSSGVFMGVEWSPWSMTQSGYPLMCNAFLMWSFSFCNSVGSLIIMIAWCSNVLVTPCLCCKGWILLKFKYWSVWVLFWNTLVLIDPSLLIMDHVSKKANYLSVLSSIFSRPAGLEGRSTSPSVGHCISSSMVFRWSIKACAWIFLSLVCVSSTYPFHQSGRCAKVFSAFCSKSSKV